MPSSRRSKKITDEILEDFALPDYPAREMSSMASSTVGSRAIDRYVASVLSESDDDSIYSTARKSASAASHHSRSVHFNDDSSFEPVNPFDGSPDETYYASHNKWKRKIQKHWKPLSSLAFGVVVIVLIVAGVASNKNSDARPNPDDGNKAVGVPITVTSTTAPDEADSSSEPTYFPTTASTLTVSEGPTFMPSYVPTVDNSTDSVTTEPPLKLTARPIAPPTTRSPSKKPTPKPTPVTKNPTTSSPVIKPTPKPVTIIPTSKPTPGPTMPEKYFEMLKAAQFISGKTPFDRTDTTQSLAFHWLYYSGNPSSNLYEFFEQYATAVIFFALTKMHTSSLMPQDAGNDFTTRREICGWSGVRCAYNYTSEMVHVTEIKLPAMKLSGSIPSEIGFLPYLVTIDLANNDITGTIPEELYGLQRLKHLYLDDNKLQGTISPRIDELNLAECKLLKVTIHILHQSNHRMYSKHCVPTTKAIYLGQNNLTGTFPSVVGTRRPNNWRFLSVHKNKLSGNLPSGMSLKNAYMLDFSNNNFYGKLPNDITQGNFNKLRLLYLNNNAFAGTIPESLMQLRKLKGLFLNDNRKYTIVREEFYGLRLYLTPQYELMA